MINYHQFADLLSRCCFLTLVIHCIHGQVVQVIIGVSFDLLSGLMCELLWSDPQPQPGRGPSKRGVGLSFGGDVTKRFLQENNLGTNLFLSLFSCLNM